MHYAISDIHGNQARWHSVLEQIDLQPEDQLYVLGDVIDRYPDGIEILCEIMDRPNLRMLKGNHEYMMQQYFASGCAEAYKQLWYYNGGEATHRAFEQCTKERQTDILDYIAALPLCIELEVCGKKLLLVHSVPLDPSNPAICEYASLEEYAVWHRAAPEERLSADKLVIFGHTPVFFYDLPLPPTILFLPDKIDIDCGSGYPFGRLACLRLEDMSEYYSC